MRTVRTDEIIAYAKDLKKQWGNNPINIARRFGINVLINDSNEIKAQTIKLDNYPTIISIYGCKDPIGQRVLCAHELGHALLHNDFVNKYSGSYKTLINETEYEANLFAVALLFDDKDFYIPISRMSNYLLKAVHDYNIRK